MKKRMTVFLVLCLAMIFVCSCQNGDSAADVAGGALYKVNFSVELPADGPQRTISYSGGSVSAGLTFWYKATPQWTDGYAPGKEDVFVNIEDYVSEKVLDAQFQQGQWKFDVQVKSGENVVYAGSTTVYINAADTPVIVTVSRGGEGVGKGKIAFDTITAAKINPTLNLNKVLMEYGPKGQGATAEQTVTCASDSPSLSFEIADVENLPAGNYWVKLTYLNDTAEVGDAIVNFTLDAGQTATVSGNLDEGQHQTALITINGISSLTLSDIESTATDGVVTFTCTATPADGATYEWFVYSEKVNGATGSSFEWTPDAYQNASITCTATRGNIVVSKSTTYQVIELPPATP